jgi:hypothetical protein
MNNIVKPGSPERHLELEMPQPETERSSLRSAQSPLVVVQDVPIAATERIEPGAVDARRRGSASTLLSAVLITRDAVPVALPEYFGQALAQVADLGTFGPEQMRHMRSDLTVTGKLTRTPLDRLPCDPCLLRPLLQRVLPARHRITAKRWSSMKSTLARVLRIVGWCDPSEARTPLAEQWQAARDCLPYTPQKPALSNFARFCHREGIRPEDVSEQTIEAYRDWKTRRTLELDVPHAITTARRLWNWCVRHAPDWPQRPLRAPRDPRCYALGIEAVHPGLRSDIEACCAQMARFSPLDPRQTRKYSPATIKQTWWHLLQAAAVLVRKGAGVDSLQNLRDVLNPAAYRCVLEDHAERLGGGEGWAASSATLATNLKRAARISGALTDTEMAEVERLCRLVRFPPPRLTRKARERISQFDDATVMRRYLRLTTECFAAADRMRREGAPKKAARLHQRALAIAI